MPRITVNTLMDHIERWDRHGEMAKADSLLVLMRHSLSPQERAVYSILDESFHTLPECVESYADLAAKVLGHHRHSLSPDKMRAVLMRLSGYGLVRHHIDIHGMDKWGRKYLPTLPKA